MRARDLGVRAPLPQTRRYRFSSGVANLASGPGIGSTSSQSTRTHACSRPARECFQGSSRPGPLPRPLPPVPSPAPGPLPPPRPPARSLCPCPRPLPRPLLSPPDTPGIAPGTPPRRWNNPPLCSAPIRLPRGSISNKLSECLISITSGMSFGQPCSRRRHNVVPDAGSASGGQRGQGGRRRAGRVAPPQLQSVIQEGSHPSSPKTAREQVLRITGRFGIQEAPWTRRAAAGRGLGAHRRSPWTPTSLRLPCLFTPPPPACLPIKGDKGLKWGPGVGKGDVGVGMGPSEPDPVRSPSLRSAAGPSPWDPGVRPLQLRAQALTWFQAPASKSDSLPGAPKPGWALPPLPGSLGRILSGLSPASEAGLLADPSLLPAFYQWGDQVVCGGPPP